jgi:hypothetical protein
MAVGADLSCTSPIYRPSVVFLISLIICKTASLLPLMRIASPGGRNELRPYMSSQSRSHSTSNSSTLILACS